MVVVNLRTLSFVLRVGDLTVVLVIIVIKSVLSIKFNEKISMLLSFMGYTLVSHSTYSTLSIVKKYLKETFKNFLTIDRVKKFLKETF